MMIPKSNQSYDIADLAAQPSVTGAGTAAGAARQQWEDDGGPLQVRPPICPLEFSSKPTWSVLSLRDLNLAIRVGHWPDNPAALQRAAADAERSRAKAKAAAAATAAEARDDDGIDHQENP
jgi:hypothetical protein